MNSEELKAVVLDVLLEIAPETDVDGLDSGANFRDQIEIDSVDYLNFVLSLEKRLGMKIPEADYPKLSTLEGCLAYLHK